jgi:hypothetical protein
MAEAWCEEAAMRGRQITHETTVRSPLPCSRVAQNVHLKLESRPTGNMSRIGPHSRDPDLVWPDSKRRTKRSGEVVLERQAQQPSMWTQSFPVMLPSGRFWHRSWVRCLGQWHFQVTSTPA